MSQHGNQPLRPQTNISPHLFLSLITPLSLSTSAVSAFFSILSNSDQNSSHFGLDENLEVTSNFRQEKCEVWTREGGPSASLEAWLLELQPPCTLCPLSWRLCPTEFLWGRALGVFRRNTLIKFLVGEGENPKDMVQLWKTNANC